VDKIRGIYEKDPGSGVWWIRYTDHTGRLRREKGGRRSDAKTLLDKRRTEALQKRKLPEQYTVKKPVTFRELCDDVIEYSEITNNRKEVETLKSRINVLIPVFGQRVASSITKQEITRWLETEARARSWAPATRNRWQMTFSLIFRVGVDNEKLSANPASRIKQRTENNAVLRYLLPDEEKRLREQITNPIRLSVFELALNTGMRQGEIFGLRWSQIDLDRRQILLPKTKNKRPHHVPLNSAAVIALQRMRTLGGRTGLTPPASTDSHTVIFSSALMWSLRSPSGWWHTAMKNAKVTNFRFHDLRHTFASRLVMAGVDMRTVADLLNHKVLQMVMRYSHLSPEHKLSAVERLTMPIAAVPSN
jgi:integrase